MSSLSGHGKLVCKCCEKVVAQCRCPNHKEIQHTICDKCKEKAKTEVRGVM